MSSEAPNPSCMAFSISNAGSNASSVGFCISIMTLNISNVRCKHSMSGLLYAPGGSPIPDYPSAHRNIGSFVLAIGYLYMEHRVFYMDCGDTKDPRSHTGNAPSSVLYGRPTLLYRTPGIADRLGGYDVWVRGIQRIGQGDMLYGGRGICCIPPTDPVHPVLVEGSLLKNSGPASLNPVHPEPVEGSPPILTSPMAILLSCAVV